MTKLLEVVQKLTDEERQEVQAFAEFLLTRRPRPRSAPIAETGKAVRYEGWVGCLANVHPEMSDAEFGTLILDEIARTAED